MKLLTFAVPSYNSQDYLDRCVESLLVGGDDVEIIIVNDGSTDSTGAIADDYAEKYPDIVRVIHKENGGHGSGVNAGVHNASGLFFKVVDSDDWLDKDALLKLLQTIKTHASSGNLPDMYITNYVYIHTKDNTQYVMEYSKQMREGFFDWKNMKNFYFSHVMLMHSFVYNTQKLREHYTDLPQHTFYVDNIFAYVPLIYMQRPFYLDVNLYQYFIGRDGQSINIDTAISRYEQQIRVMLIMATAHDYKTIKSQPKGLKKYMFHDLHAIMMTTLTFCCGKCSKQRKSAVKQMWKTIKNFDKKLYRKIRYGGFTLAAAVLPWRLRGMAMLFGYRIICRLIKLG